MKKHSVQGRRAFLKTIGAAGSTLLLPTIVPSRVLGDMAPSKRIQVALIGVGRQGLKVNLNPFLNSENARVVAVCDVDKWRLENAKREVDDYYGDKDCLSFRDWREVVEREDIDAIMNSTPDHWHVPISLAAVRKGKHVSCEKPLTLSVAEGRLLADAVKKRGIVFRTDSECRSNAYMHQAAGLVVNGYIGKLKHSIVVVPTGDQAGGIATPTPVPPELDYDMWLGPAPKRPYALDRVHPRESYDRPGWMRCRETCEGMITNWGTHLLDVLQLAHGSERTGPVEVEGSGEYPAPDSGLWNVLLHFKARFRYADGVTVDYATGDAAYVRYEGEMGWIQSTWTSGKDFAMGLTASSPELLHAKLREEEIHLPQRADKEDFLYGILTGKPVMADAEIGHRTCSMGQIAHIAIQVGRRLVWKPDVEQFDDDAEANALLKRSIRGDWMEG